MKQLYDIVKEGLFDIGELEGKNSLEISSEQMKQDIIDWISAHYRGFSTNLKIEDLEIDMTTSPPTVNSNRGFIFKPFNDSDSLNNNGMFKFGKVKNFTCKSNQRLTTLEGSPEEVESVFDCTYCSKLRSLKGAPKKVDYFICKKCKGLKNLKYCTPDADVLDCSECENLISLEGAPKNANWVYCSDCKSLKSLKHSPKKVNGNYKCDGCTSLKDLEGAPEEVGRDFDCSWCQLESLNGCPKKVKNFFIYKREKDTTSITNDEIMDVCEIGEYIKDNPMWD
jgi:hypothetical protein